MNERASLTENVVLYATAALVCFTIAFLIYVSVVIVHMSSATVERVASLGVAWWLVGCGLLPLTAYWVWRRSHFDREM